MADTLKDWVGTFWRILISPTPRTFIEEAEKAKDKFTSAIGWTVFIALYAYLLPLIKGPTFNFTLLIYSLLIFPLVIVLVPSATHFVLQRLFHQKKYIYDKILYIYTAILVLFQLIINPVTYFVPQNIALVLNYFFITYQLALFVIATKSIANIKYWQATVTTICSITAGAVIFICALPLITSIMGGVSQTMR